jgi:glutamate racemase
MTSAPIGMFDSGVGGLSILREVRRLLPSESILYFADQAHVPHGSRTLDEVRDFDFAITDFLLSKGAKLIVVACNTDSAAALKPLRERYSNFPFIGMEPAVKPAAEQSRSGVIGVIATPATFQGELFASAVDRYGKNVRVLTQTLPGMVEFVEQGEISGPRVDSLLRERLAPLLAKHMDTIVLGCTHYPFVREAIARAVGPDVRIIDPSPAVAQQIARQLNQHGLANPSGEGTIEYFTSGEPAALARSVRMLLGESVNPKRATWENDCLK